MTDHVQQGYGFPEDRLDRTKKTGLIVAGMGGPDSRETVEPFLRNLFRDPAVLPMPRIVARLLGSYIVRKRLKKVQERYAQIGHGGGSPQRKQTEAQCAELSRLMKGQGIETAAAPAMRYWHPYPEESIEALLRQGVEQFIVVPAYPQFSGATSGSVLSKIMEARGKQAPGAPVYTLAEWPLQPGYLDALVRRSAPVLRSWAEAGHDPRQCALLFVAHSLPERFLKSGDPYVRQTRATVDAVYQRIESDMHDHHAWWKTLPGGEVPLLAYQSKVGPVRWVGPEVPEEVRRLAQSGCRHLLLVPVSFTCEHIETLHELDIELAAEAREAGVKEFVRAEALNLDAGWLTDLALVLIEAAFGLESDTADESENQEGGQHD